MSKRDYIKVASAVAVTNPKARYDSLLKGPVTSHAQHLERKFVSQQVDAMVEQWRRDVLSVADVLQADNPRFNRTTFLVAAGAVVPLARG